MTNVKESYWIQPVSMTNAAYNLIYFTNGRLSGIIVKIAHIIMFASIFWIACICIINRQKIDKQRILPSLFFMSIFIILFLSTLILSLICKPILFDRYLLSALGCYILSFAIFIAAITNISLKQLQIACIIILACITTVYILMFTVVIKKEKRDRLRQDNVLTYLSNKTEQTDKYTIIGLEQTS